MATANALAPINPFKSTVTHSTSTDSSRGLADHSFEFNDKVAKDSPHDSSGSVPSLSTVGSRFTDLLPDLKVDDMVKSRDGLTKEIKRLRRKNRIKKHKLKRIGKNKAEVQHLYKEHFIFVHDREVVPDVGCTATIKIRLDQIEKSLVKELKPEVKAHVLSASNKKKKKLQDMLRKHLQEHHNALQDAASSESEFGSEDHTDMDLDVCESERSKTA